MSGIALAGADIQRKVRSGEIASVSDDSLTQLLVWVLNVATPEDLTFDNVRFHEVRDWLKTHKSAKELRVKAIRIECIALRRVGQAGLSNRLPKPNDRKVAEWLAGLDDDRFKTVLAESEVTTTPFAVMRWIVGEDEAPRKWGSARDTEQQSNEAGADYRVYDFGLTHEVGRVLEEIVADQEDFTVAEAADKLWHKLSADVERYINPEDHDYLLPELAGEPLREVVRKVLRAPGPADRVLLNGNEVMIPNYVTFQPGGGETWKRTPWATAELWQLGMMRDLRREQAAAAERVAENMEALFVALEKATSLCDTTRVNDLIGYADVPLAATSKKPVAATTGQNISL